MQALVVDAYETRAGFNSFHRTFTSALLDSSEYEHDIIIRRLDDLGDYVCDWEHDILNENAKGVIQKFDKVDLVCIGGDMHICPWDPQFTQIITLLHMCNFIKKPILACGSGALGAIYATSTQGARFYILNGPNGETIERLPTFPRYSKGTGAYPSGWLDNETGDLYTYEPFTMMWKPTCNIGVYRIASSGKPSSPRFRPSSKKFSREDHMLAMDQTPVLFTVSFTYSFFCFSCVLLI